MPDEEGWRRPDDRRPDDTAELDLHFDDEPTEPADTDLAALREKRRRLCSRKADSHVSMNALPPKGAIRRGERSTPRGTER